MSMDPLNQKERAAAQRKFMGVYLLSILIPCIAVYFLAQSSDNRLESENTQLKSLIRLLVGVNAIESEAQKLKDIDKRFSQSTDKEMSANDLTAVNAAKDSITRTITAIKGDSAKIVSEVGSVNKDNAAGVIQNLGVFLDNWGTIKGLRETSKSAGNEAAALQDANAKLQQAEAKNDALQTKLDLMMMMAAKGGGGGGGGGDDKLKKENDELKAELKELKAGGGGGGKADAFCEARILLQTAANLKDRADLGRVTLKDVEIQKKYKEALDKYYKLMKLVDSPGITEYQKNMMKEKAQSAISEIEMKMK